MSIRWMIRRDIPFVTAIEEACFENPWTEKELSKCLKRRNSVGMVVEVNDEVQGFMVYELFKKHLFLHNLAVLPSCQKQGVGRLLINKLIGKLSPERRSNLICYVRETNLPAQLFLQKLGFLATAILEDAYDDADEDAYVMKYATKQPIPAWKNRIGVLLDN